MADQDDRSGPKRQQIIHGAEIVFTECGYEGASMSRIALQAAVSKGTLYNYFASKSDLFAAFVSQKAATTLSQVFEPVADQGRLDVILHEIGRRMVRQILSPGSLVLFRIVMSEAGKFPHLARIYWDAGPQMALLHMADWLTGQMRSGILRRADPHVAAGQFFALCQAPACTKRRLQLVSDLSPGEIEAIIDGAVRVFLDSYALPGLAPST